MSRILLLLLLSLVLSRAFWRLIGGVIAGLNAAPPTTGSPGQQQAVHMQRDPVCGTFVVPSTALVLTDGSRKLYFCSDACRDAYRARTA
jgi:YHS domain-containing protein